MKLWTIQPIEAIKEIENKGYYSTNIEEIDLDFIKSYDWIVEKMKNTIGDAPEGIKYPLWAWHTYNGKHQRPDFRNSGYAKRGSNLCCIEFEIEENKVLLSDFDSWHIVLNNGFYFDFENEKESSKKYENILKLPKEEQQKEKVKTWDKVFINKENLSNTNYIQATFWKLEKEKITDIKKFVAK